MIGQVARPAAAAAYPLTGDTSRDSCGGTYLCAGELRYDVPTGLDCPDGLSAFREL